MQLTNIALQSTNSGQSERPDLETEVIPLLERLHTIGKTAEMQDLERMREAAREAERRRGPQAEPTSMKEFVEMHFLCPISQVSVLWRNAFRSDSWAHLRALGI